VSIGRHRGAEVARSEGTSPASVLRGLGPWHGSLFVVGACAYLALLLAIVDLVPGRTIDYVVVANVLALIARTSFKIGDRRRGGR
jgi:hypothetical protein